LTALIIFLIAGFLLVYVYLGYPLFITVLARHRVRHLKPEDYPRVTVLFCAHNEEAVLPDKIANCKALDYPAELLEFCVGSDGSTDGTAALLQPWAKDQRVRLTLSPERVGKTALLNCIVPTAAGEIVLFSDASTLFPPDTVWRHVAHYADPTVGCVGGNLVFVNAAHSPVSGAHGAYWRYERHLRRCESSLGILACVAGAHYSIRRRLWRSVEPRFADDCNSPLNVIEQGYGVVYDPEASAHEVAAESSTGLMRRRVRMVTRDLEAILARPAVLNPLRFPGVAWSLWSHKVLRWLGAPLLVMLLVSNLSLLHLPLFQVIFGCQLVFYGLGLTGYLLQGEVRSRWLSLPLYFSLSNLAALRGLVNVLRRKPAVTWQPGGTS
jgi:cellulose synthase/poly-beta-1,6-N-acetylglucosamine synthase-like glycosyltransferase